MRVVDVTMKHVCGLSGWLRCGVSFKCGEPQASRVHLVRISPRPFSGTKCQPIIIVRIRLHTVVVEMIPFPTHQRAIMDSHVRVD